MSHNIESSNQYFSRRNTQSNWELNYKNNLNANSKDKLNKSLTRYSVNDYKSESKFKQFNNSYTDLKNSVFKRTRSNAKSLWDKIHCTAEWHPSFEICKNEASNLYKHTELEELNEVRNSEINHKPSVTFVTNLKDNEYQSKNIRNKSLDINVNDRKLLMKTQEQEKRNWSILIKKRHRN